MENTPSTSPQFSMAFACEQTGLTPDVIRAWERRYRAVEPARTAGNQRAFSEADIHRLKLLRQATRVGRSISKIAFLSDDELVALVTEDQARLHDRPRVERNPAELSQRSILLRRCLEAVERLDAAAFERQLELALTQLGWTRTMDEVLVPLMRQIGELWSEGSLRMAHERLASSLVRSFVGSMYRAYTPQESAPGIVVATPRGQRHELGATLVAATAAAEGWKVSYLGADLPIDDIAMAVLETEFDVIALSLTHPYGDPELIDRLRKLRRLIGPRRTLIVGGQATSSYSEVLDEIGALRIPRLSGLRRELAERFDGEPQRHDAYTPFPGRSLAGLAQSAIHRRSPVG